MRRLRQSQFVRSVLLPLSLLMWLSACGPHKVELASPYARTIELDPPESVYVRLSDGESVTIRSPTVRADSLHGLAYNGRTRRYTDSVTVAFSDISMIEKNRMSTASTTIALLAVVGLLIVVVATSDWSYFED